jgi:hypothetical protein
MLVQTKEVAAFFGVTRQAVGKWVDAGCPKLDRGRFNLKDVHGWWLLNIYAERAANDDEGLAEAKRRYWTAKADRETMAANTQKKDLIHKDEIYTQWAGRMAEYKSGLFYFVDSLPPLLEGKTQPEMRKLIDDLVWKMFDRLCRTGSFTPEVKD